MDGGSLTDAKVVEEINLLPRKPTKCPSCGHDNYDVIREKDFRGLLCRNVICKSCGLVYINPRMPEAAYRKFYEIYYRTSYQHYRKPLTLEKYFENEVKEGNAFISYLRENGYDPKGKRVLDIGCGAGGAVKAFHDYGCDASGIDYNPDYIHYGRSKKLELYVGGIEDMDGKWDVIILSHVIEHLTDPVKDLGKISKLLGDYGIVFIQTPGVLNLKYAAYDLDADFEIPHVCNYSLASLKTVMNRANYEFLHGDEGINAIFMNMDIMPPNSWSDYEKVKLEIQKAQTVKSRGLLKTKNKLLRSGIYVSKKVLPKKVFLSFRKKYLKGE